MLQSNEITDKKTWENFLSKKDILFYPFFQSWDWGEVQKKLGFSISRIGIFDSTKKPSLIGICQMIDVPARRGHYIHLRHGPVFHESKAEYVQFFMETAISFAKEQHASFIRLSPFVGDDAFLLPFKKKLRHCPMHNMDAELCWILPLNKSEEELLREMKKNHRYLIKKAQGMEIEIIRTTNSSDIEKFLPLYKGLSVRKHFIPHGGVAEEFNIFAEDDRETLFLAEYQGQIIAGAIVAFVPGMAIYRHGASSEAFRDVPASYLIQWEAIREAKERGATWYNFWGVAPEGATHHPWQGLTHFKKGFGGHEQTFIHALDYPLSNWYWKTYMIEYYTKRTKGY